MCPDPCIGSALGGITAAVPWGRSLHGSAAGGPAGRATGLEGVAEGFIRRERETCEAALRLARDHALRGCRIGLIGDPHVAPRLAEFVEDLGGRFAGWLSTQYPAPELDGIPGPDALTRAEVDLVLTSTMGCEVLGQRRIPYLEFGFPSYGRHALSETPFLGYRGAVSLAEHLANSIRFFEDLRATGLLEPARPFRHEPAL